MRVVLVSIPLAIFPPDYAKRVLEWQQANPPKEPQPEFIRTFGGPRTLPKQ